MLVRDILNNNRNRNSVTFGAGYSPKMKAVRIVYADTMKNLVSCRNDETVLNILNINIELQKILGYKNFEKLLFSFSGPQKRNTILHTVLKTNRDFLAEQMLTREDVKKNLVEILSKKDDENLSVLDFALKNLRVGFIRKVFKEATLNQQKKLFLIKNETRNVTPKGQLAEDVISGKFYKDDYFTSIPIQKDKKISGTKQSTHKLDEINDVIEKVEYDACINLSKDRVDMSFDEYLNEIKKQLDSEIERANSISADEDEIDFNSDVIKNMKREVLQEVVEKYVGRLHQLFKDKDFTLEVLEGKPRFLERQKQVLEYVDLNENNILINALQGKLPLGKVCDAIQKTGDLDLFLKLLRHKNLEGESVKSLLGKNYKDFCKYMKEGIAKYSNLE